MTNEFYDPGSERVAKVNRLFTRIARRYDLLNDIQSFGLHRLWKRRVVEMARAYAGERALDVCCGTGDIAFALASRGAETVGLDFNESMLQVAAPPQLGCSFPRGGDGRSCEPGFSARGRPASALPGESLRCRDCRLWVAKSRGIGKAGCGKWREWRGPGLDCWCWILENPTMRSGARFTLATFACSCPVLGLVFCGSASAYAYILESLRHYPAQNGVAEEMRRLGLKNVQVHNLLGGVMSINYGEKL